MIGRRGWSRTHTDSTPQSAGHLTGSDWISCWHALHGFHGGLPCRLDCPHSMKSNRKLNIKKCMALAPFCHLHGTRVHICALWITWDLAYGGLSNLSQGQAEDRGSSESGGLGKVAGLKGWSQSIPYHQGPQGRQWLPEAESQPVPTKYHTPALRSFSSPSLDPRSQSAGGASSQVLG